MLRQWSFYQDKIFVNICNVFLKKIKVFRKNADNISTERTILMLKKIERPTNNTSSCVEFILRGAKKRRTMAIAEAMRVNAASGVQTELRAVK